jgi:excisionase family DNA binding protein
VAKYLPVNPQTVRNWIDRRELGAIHVGDRRVRIRQSERERFVTAGETQPRTESETASSPDVPADLNGVMAEILRAQYSAEIVAVLRALAGAAELLADAIAWDNS